MLLYTTYLFLFVYRIKEELVKHVSITIESLAHTQERRGFNPPNDPYVGG